MLSFRRYDEDGRIREVRDPRARPNASTLRQSLEVLHPRPLTRMSSRSRALQACEQCRDRKVRCTGGKPVCDRCEKHTRPCLWPDSVSARFRALSPENSSSTNAQNGWSTMPHTASGISASTPNSTTRRSLQAELTLNSTQAVFDAFHVRYGKALLCDCVDRLALLDNSTTPRYHFLSQAIFSLVTLTEAAMTANSGQYTENARRAARAASDQPGSK